jgi:hypothetical protein
MDVAGGCDKDCIVQAGFTEVRALGGSSATSEMFDALRHPCLPDE